MVTAVSTVGSSFQDEDITKIPKNSQGPIWACTYVYDVKNIFFFGFLLPSRGSTPFSRWPAADAAALALATKVRNFPELKPILSLIALMSAAPSTALSCCPCIVYLSVCFNILCHIFIYFPLGFAGRKGWGHRPCGRVPGQGFPYKEWASRNGSARNRLDPRAGR